MAVAPEWRRLPRSLERRRLSRQRSQQTMGAGTILKRLATGTTGSPALHGDDDHYEDDYRLRRRTFLRVNRHEKKIHFTSSSSSSVLVIIYIPVSSYLPLILSTHCFVLSPSPLPSGPLVDYSTRGETAPKYRTMYHRVSLAFISPATPPLLTLQLS